MSLLGHLEELRARLLACFWAVLVGVVLGWFVSGQAIELLIQPIQSAGLVARPSDAQVLQLELGKDGRLSIRGGAALHQALATRGNSEPAKEAQPAPLSRMEIFLEGTDKPAAVWQSVARSGVIYLRPMDPFLIRLKAAMMLGVALALPVILHQIYAFVSPGLLPHEKVWVAPCYLAAILLFPVGVAFAYFLLKYALIFFAQYVSPDAYVFNDVRAYLSFALTTMLAFGVVFELPIVVLVLTRIGLVGVETLAAKRKLVFVGVMVLSAVVTPTGDPFTLMAMTLPLYVLFEISLVVSRLADRAAAAGTASLAGGAG